MNKYLFWRFSQESILFSKYNNTMVFFLVLLQFLIQGQVLTDDGEYPKVWNKISLPCFHFPKLQEKIRKNKCPSICQQTDKRAFEESNVLLFNCKLGTVLKYRYHSLAYYRSNAIYAKSTRCPRKDILPLPIIVAVGWLIFWDTWYLA